MRGGRGEEDGHKQMGGLGEQNKDEATAVEDAEWGKKLKKIRLRMRANRRIKKTSDCSTQRKKQTSMSGLNRNSIKIVRR